MQQKIVEAQVGDWGEDAVPFMSFSRSYTINAYPLCAFFFFFDFSPSFSRVSVIIRICTHHH